MPSADPATPSLIDLALARGAAQASWVTPADIVVARWVRMKCEFGCGWYGKCAACPPNLPSIDECRELFAEYGRGLLLRFSSSVDVPEARHAWTREINESLLALERDVFLSGHPKALVFFVDPCNLCDSCASTRRGCHDKVRARPSPEGMGVDVFSTAEVAGMPLRVLTDYDQTMNRYSLLLVD